MKKVLTLLFISALTAGCGEIKSTLGKIKRNVTSVEVKSSILDQAQFAIEANDMAELGDDADATTGEDDAALSADGGASAAPAGPDIMAMAALPDGADITYYDCSPALKCLPSKIVIDREAGGKKIGSFHTELTLNYYDTVTAAQTGLAGNHNTDARLAALKLFVRADINQTATLSRVGSDDSATLTTTGYRVWTFDPDLWYVVDTKLETTGFPARPNGKPSVVSVNFARTFAAPNVTVHTGTSEKLVTYSDATTKSTVRYAAFDVDTRQMTGGWTNTGRKGFLGVGTFDINVGATPFCRLDDTGTVTIHRTFGEAATNVTSEHIAMTKEGVKLTIEGLLTMADGTTKSKSLVRTQTAPTACGDRGEGTRSFTITGTGYGGNEITFEETRTPGNITIHAERVMKDTGNVQTIDAVRTEGVLNIRASVVDAQGNALFEAHLVLHGNGNGEGQITRTVDGVVIRTNFSVENGKIVVQDKNGKSEEAGSTVKPTEE